MIFFNTGIFDLINFFIANISTECTSLLERSPCSYLSNTENGYMGNRQNPVWIKTYLGTAV
jgi:hypothetical protein